MENNTSTPDPKDTSAPGREEEVIVNTEVQQQETNNLTFSHNNEPASDIPASNESGKLIGDNGNSQQRLEKAYKEGLEDNSSTDDEPIL